MLRVLCASTLLVACSSVTPYEDGRAARDDERKDVLAGDAGRAADGALIAANDGASAIALGDDRPDSFDFTDVANAKPSTEYKASALVQGFEGTLVASVSGGAEIGVGGTFGATVNVTSGATIEVRMTSSATPGAAKTALVTVGTSSADWTVTTASECAAQNVTWTVGASTCTVASGGVLAADAAKSVTDSTLDDTGKATITCTGGAIVVTNALCEPPHVFDVASNTGCINGYCSAATAGQCGVANPATATAYCVLKGYAAHTTYATMPGPYRASQCGPDGTGCFVNQNSECNIVFSSITCRY